MHAKASNKALGALHVGLCTCWEFVYRMGFALCRRPPGLCIMDSYGWIRTKKLICLLPFSARMARTLSISCPSSFQNLLFCPFQGWAKFRLLLDFPRISDFRGGTSWGFDFDKSSTIWNSKAYGWIRMKKLICLLPFFMSNGKTIVNFMSILVSKPAFLINFRVG